MKIVKIMMIAVLLTSMVFGSLAARGAAEPTEGRRFEGVTLTIAENQWPHSDSMRELVTEWEEETGMNIRIEQMDINALTDKLTMEAQARSPEIDIFNLSPGWVGVVTELGYIHPLDDLMDQYGVEFESDYPSATKDLITYPGKDAILAFPYVVNAHMLVFNENYLLDDEENAAFRAQYGYDMAPPDTMEELLDIAQYFTRDDMYGFAKPIGSHGDADQMMTWLIWSHGGEVYDLDTYEVLINSPESRAALEYGRKLYDTMPPDTVTWRAYEQAAFYNQGRVAMIPVWFSFVAQLLDERESALADVTGVTTQPGMYWMGGNGLAINTHSRNKEAAFEFLTWLTSAEVALDWVEMGGGPITRTSTMNSDIVAQNFPGLAEVYPLKNEAIDQHSRSRFLIPQRRLISEELHRVWFDLVEDRMSIDENLATAEANLKSIFAEAGLK